MSRVLVTAPPPLLLGFTPRSDMRRTFWLATGLAPRSSLAGVQPNGPVGIQELRAKRSHHRHHHHGSGGTKPTEPNDQTGGNDNSIDVTDAGGCLNTYQICTGVDSDLVSSRYLYHLGEGW